jgi:hypothetical protein
MIHTWEEEEEDDDNNNKTEQKSGILNKCVFSSTLQRHWIFIF